MKVMDWLRNAYNTSHYQVSWMTENVDDTSHSCIAMIDATPPPWPRVFALYCGLQYGLSVRDWIEEHQVATLPIDVR